MFTGLSLRVNKRDSDQVRRSQFETKFKEFTPKKQNPHANFDVDVCMDKENSQTHIKETLRNEVRPSVRM
jgi:hypothetical protein